MGLAESYRLPKKYNEAYHLTGDGVAVPVVRFLSHYLFEPLAIGRCVAETGSGKVTSVGR
ncbi:hypothetical protein D3C87_2163200 [compost metagenome]